jgi:RNA polymerase sigma-70 factor (ECF subfamily)
MTIVSNDGDRPRSPSLSSSIETDLAHELLVRSVYDAGDLKRAATLVLERHSAAIARFLSVRLRSGTLADEAFSQFCEDLWRGLPGFRFTAPVRVWVWILARNAATRVASAGFRKRERLVEHEEAFAQVSEHVRTSTARFLRTETKQGIRELRAQLSDDEQTLLVLRIDRELSWKELAIIMGEAPSEATDSELARASARVRTRFQAIKQRLRALADRAGLLAP